MLFRTRRMTAWDVLPAIVMFLAVALCLVAGFTYMTELPTVYKSATTGKCLYVHDESTMGARRLPCDPLPERYNTVWVDAFVHPVGKR